MGTLAAAICGCGQIMLPPKTRCVKCSGHTEPLDIANTGKILSFTVLHATPEGFEAPLILGIIEIDHAKEVRGSSIPKIVCEGKVHEEDLKIGLKVKIEKINEKYYFM